MSHSHFVQEGIIWNAIQTVSLIRISYHKIWVHIYFVSNPHPLLQYGINSLSPGRCCCNFDCMVLKHIWYIIISSWKKALGWMSQDLTDNESSLVHGLVPSGNMPLCEPTLIHIYDAIWRHYNTYRYWTWTTVDPAHQRIYLLVVIWSRKRVAVIPPIRVLLVMKEVSLIRLILFSMDIWGSFTNMD